MCTDKLYDKIIRNSKEAERQYLSMATNMISSKKCNKSPLTDEAFKEQLERVLRDNVLDTDIRITGDTVIGAKINPEDKGLFLRSLSDEAILKECKERGLDVKYSEEENLAYRLNWVIQDYYKAGEDDEEREHRFKCYKLFWDALEDANFFKFEPKKQKPVDTMDEFTWNIRNLITDKLTIRTKGLDGSEISSTVFIDDKTAKDIASGILFYVGKEALKNPNREIPEWDDNFEEAVADLIERAKQGKCDSLSPIEEGNKLLAIAKHGKVNQKEWSEKDARILKGIIGLVDHDQHYGVGNKEMVSWLKSLRPTWKPSEEELIALKCAGSILRDYGHGELAKTVFMIEGKLANLSVINKSIWKSSEKQMEAPRNVPPIEGVRKLL